jgi:hypothetical protein
LSQTQIIVLLLKIGLVSGLAAITGWIAVYHALTTGGWRKNPVGRTLVIEALLIALLFVPQILSLFFDLTRLDSRIAAWSDVVLIGLVTPVMLWRVIVWLRLDKAGQMGSAPDTPDLVPPSPQDRGQHEDCGQYGTG